MLYLPGAIALGVLAALSPGPLLVLAGKETLRAGFGAGFRVSLIPSLASLPLPVVCVYGHTWAERWAKSAELRTSAIALMTLLSATLFAWFAYRELRPRASSQDLQPSWWALALIGWSSPAIMLFWATVGSQLASTAHRQHGWIGVALVIAGFYTPIALCEAVIIYCLHIANTKRSQLNMPQWLQICQASRLWQGIQRVPWGALLYLVLALWLVVSNWPSLGRFGSVITKFASAL